jgi:hypothetical protein
MRKRGWRVGVLAEFLPEQSNLLGTNVFKLLCVKTELIYVKGLNKNRGQEILIRLRYNHNPTSFLPFENCLDTMLHEYVVS